MFNLSVIENLYIVDFPCTGDSIFVVADSESDVYEIILNFKKENGIPLCERFDISKADEDNRVNSNINLCHKKILYKGFSSREKAIITAYTGVNMMSHNDFDAYYEYLSDLFDEKISNAVELSRIGDEIKEKSKEDFFKLCEKY